MATPMKKLQTTCGRIQQFKRIQKQISEESHGDVPGRMFDSSHLIVVALDFGTTYSGYAVSFRGEPSKIMTNQAWSAGTEGLISPKTPTTILLKPNKEFHSFGYEAEDKYSELCLNDEHHGWLFFKNFKMKLYNAKVLSRDTTIEDINGKSLSAMTIYSMALRYLREHCLDLLNSKVTSVKERDIRYVVTVPEISNDSAKQFMREAALKSGMESSRLILALEPEAASIWCKEVKPQEKQLLAVGSKYMVVDLGGGTADITVHEVQPREQLKELHEASGGPWGGNFVNENYISFLTEIFGKDTIDRFKLEHMIDFIDIHREFETKKRRTSFNIDGKIIFKIVASMKDIFEDVEKESLEKRISDHGLSDKITIKNDKLLVDSSIVKGWFDDPVDAMIKHVKQILDDRKMEEVELILLVGGFGESQYVQKR